MRKNPNSDIALSKTAVKGVIDIVPADTKSLTTGNYVYDIQLTTFGGNIYTIVPISNFEIGEDPAGFFPVHVSSLFLLPSIPPVLSVWSQ